MKSKKTIVLYSDEKYFNHVVNTIESFRRVGEEFQFLYFQIGFEIPVFVYKMEVICISLEKVEGIPLMQLMKPTILRKSLEFCDHFVYVDCDALASKNFNYDLLISRIKGFPYGPLLHETYWQNPLFIWDNGESRFELNESEMMRYLNVEYRTQPWVTTLLLAVDSSCLNFIIEWENICKDPLLWDPRNKLEEMNMPWVTPRSLYFHMGDETPYNVLLWREKVEGYYEKYIILEPKEDLTFLIIENLDISETRIEKDNPLTDVKDSRMIFLYHNLKDLNFKIKILNYLYAQDNRQYRRPID